MCTQVSDMFELGSPIQRNSAKHEEWLIRNE